MVCAKNPYVCSLFGLQLSLQPIENIWPHPFCLFYQL